MSRYVAHAKQANAAVDQLVIEVREMLDEMPEDRAFQVLAVALMLQPGKVLTAAIFSLFRLARQEESVA